MSKLILIRGISGSGKSTLAELIKLLNPTFKHYEADMYFMQNGVYRFNGKFLKQAHAWCFQHTKESLERGENVVVANTFIKRWQVAPYLKLCEAYSCEATIFACRGNYQNVHNVPENTVLKMKKDWEETVGKKQFNW